ncbi:MAG: hypothetical protein HYX22_00185 [Candidatus Yanofskybacteria bacterium]|nr:hypothetical protein [Candidatus Yanofskybacteria bacterium]
MYNNFLLALGPGWMTVVILLAVWSLVWKGMALWKSARRAHKVWFVVLLVTNTVGILDILYLYVFSKKSKSVER